MPNKPAAPEDEDAYSGRWVARVGGKIVGQGGTPQAARRAAQGARHKEKAEISYMPARSSTALSPLLERVAALAQDQEIYLVGGAVRDALLGKTSHDFDLAVPAHAIELARRTAAALGADFYILDEAFDAARVIVTDSPGTRDFLDFSSFRGGDILSDLEGRDFTINAIALDLKGGTSLDPVRGTEDLRSKTIRLCRSTSVQDDPIRILRAVRLAAALEFKIEPATREAMKEAASGLTGISPERQRDELFRMLGGPRPEASMRALEMLGVLPYVLPELPNLRSVEQPAPHVHDVWEHTLSVMHQLDEMLGLLTGERSETGNGMMTSLLTLAIGRYREQIREHLERRLNPDRSLRALLQFASLYHDVGKPGTKSVDGEGRIHFIGHEHEGARMAEERARQLALSNSEIARISDVIENHLRFFFMAARMEDGNELPSRRAVYRFFRDANESAVDLILVGLADLRAARGHTLTETAWKAWLAVARELFESLWEKPQESVAPPRLVDGHGLQRELRLQPGPVVGQLLEAIREAQAAGEIESAEQALEFGRKWLAAQGQR